MPSVLEMVRDAIQAEKARKAAVRREVEIVISDMQAKLGLTREQAWNEVKQFVAAETA